MMCHAISDELGLFPSRALAGPPGLVRGLHLSWSSYLMGSHPPFHQHQSYLQIDVILLHCYSGYKGDAPKREVLIANREEGD